MDTKSISESVDKYYRKMSVRTRAWAFVGIVALLLLLLLAAGIIVYQNCQRNRIVAEYEALLETSRQNYYLQTVSNSNLEKKLQDLNLELAKLRNTTIDLESMLYQLSEDKANLEEIRRQMEIGIRRSKSQLDNMQNSVNSLINQRTKSINYTEETIIYERSDTHGK